VALSAFDDESRGPDAGQLRTVLGPAESLWRQLLAHAVERDPSVVELWHFAGSRYGWSLRLKQKDRVLVHMTPCKEHFLAGIVLGEKTIASAQARGLLKPVLAAIEEVPRYAEGRGIRRKVASAADLRVVKRLLELKMSGGPAATSAR
jgi:hypothetical protein